MSLKLGIQTMPESSMSFADLYLKSMQVELDLALMVQKMKDLENARQIQATAKKYASQECIAFAEELLGFSIEVDLSKIGIAGKYSDSHAMFVSLANKLDNYASQMWAIFASSSKEDMEKIAAATKKYEKKFDELMKKALSMHEKYKSILKSLNLRECRIFDGDALSSPQELSKYLKGWARYSRILANTGKADKALQNNPKLGECMREGTALVRSTLAVGFTMLRDIRRIKKTNN